MFHVLAILDFIPIENADKRFENDCKPSDDLRFALYFLWCICQVRVKRFYNLLNRNRAFVCSSLFYNRVSGTIRRFEHSRISLEIARVFCPCTSTAATVFDKPLIENERVSVVNANEGDYKTSFCQTGRKGNASQLLRG